MNFEIYTIYQRMSLKQLLKKTFETTDEDRNIKESL